LVPLSRLLISAACLISNKVRLLPPLLLNKPLACSFDEFQQDWNLPYGRLRGTVFLRYAPRFPSCRTCIFITVLTSANRS
jgi:hypothetical protein